MNQPSRSQSIDHKDSYRGGDYGQDDRRDNNYGDNDGRYNNSRSPGGRGSPEPVGSNSGNVLYVGNLSRRTTEEGLTELFGKYGKVDKIDMIKDPFTHECRGFAFIAYIDGRDATDAMENLDQKEFDGRKMKVEKSKRGIGYQKTPGEYLGQFKSHNGPRSGSPSRRRDFSRGGGRRPSRERYHRDRSPRERSPRDPRDRQDRHYHHRDDRDYRDRERDNRYRRSRSRSFGRGDRDRDGGYHQARRHHGDRGGDRGGYRERSFSRDRYRNDRNERNDNRYRGGDRERSRSKGRR